MVWPGAMVVIASICTGWYVPSTLLSLAPPDPDVGSVSCGVWQMACRRVLKIGEGIIKDFVGKIRSAANLLQGLTSYSDSSSDETGVDDRDRGEKDLI